MLTAVCVRKRVWYCSWTASSCRMCEQMRARWLKDSAASLRMQIFSCSFSVALEPLTIFLNPAPVRGCLLVFGAWIMRVT